MRACLIPARGGSKRIPKKNIRSFHGKPIIGWSIEAARQSGLFDEVLVSTDDDEVARVALDFGAEVPFRRPAALADDHTGTFAVVRHAVEFMESAGRDAEQWCCLHATAPFVRERHLRAAHQLLVDTGADFTFSATTFAFPVQRSLLIDSDGAVTPHFPEHLMTRSQDLEPAVHDAGQFYWGTARSFVRYDSPFSARSLAYLLPRTEVQDIDTPDDWQVAERLFAQRTCVS